MLKAARVFLVLGIAGFAVGTLARLAGFHTENLIPVVNVSPNAFWEGSVSMMLISGCFSLLELAQRGVPGAGEPAASEPKKDDDPSE